MIHRKHSHTPIQCMNFSMNKCIFTDDKCWYSHKKPRSNLDNQGEMKDAKKDEIPEPQGFQAPPVNLAPPSNETTPSQATWLSMMSMMADLKQMMGKFKQFQ